MDIIAVIMLMLASAFGNNVPKDYCFMDVFQPECKENEVILMDSALYGRMRMGECLVGTTPDKIGCYANVLKLMDYLCSGKRSCSVRATHSELVSLNPCSSRTLPTYLSVSYSCIPVVSKHLCAGRNPTEIKKSGGYLLHSLTSSDHCPVILKSESGGQFNLSVFNFMKPMDKPACYEVAVVKETNGKKSIHVCQNDPRLKSVHLSTSSTLEVTFTQSTDPGMDMKFLLYFKVQGCPSPPVPENAHAIREGDTATIVCNNSDTTWTTTCKDNKWTQIDRECPTGWGLSDIVKTSKEFPYGIFLTSIIGVSLGVLIGGFLLFLAINAFQRYQRRGQQYGPPPVIPDPDYKIYDTAKMDLPFVPGLGHSTLPRHQMAAADVPPAPPPLSEATMKRLSRHTYERPNFPSM